MTSLFSSKCDDWNEESEILHLVDSD